MTKIRLDDDFRSALEAAVAYRLTEIYKVDSEEARRRVREFAIYGTQGRYHSQVLRAGYELFQPVLGASVPFLRSLLQAAVIAVQAEVQRGEAAEEATSG